MRKRASRLIYLIATLCLSVGIATAQQLPGSNVNVVVNRDGVNIRLIPALGAEVVGNVNAGTKFQALARSPDNEWLKVIFLGQEAWIGSVVVTVLSGDINALPVADPRTIPYGGFESPRAGVTSATGPVQGRLADNGVRVRSGPSRAYVILANAPRLTVFSVLGRAYENTWLQVNFEGTLGWVSAQEVTIVTGDVNSLPVDGIVAEALPISQPTEIDYFGTLRLMRDRLNLAQPSLDAIRAIWTEVALGGRAQCGNYPAQPTGINIPNPLLAAFFDTLSPLQQQFNEAMANLRQAVDLLIQSCSFSQPPEGSVGQGVVEQALDIINRTDVQLADLRTRLNLLIPPEGPLPPNQCLFIYESAFDILWLVQQGQVYVDHFTPKDTLKGYCFDATEGQILTITAAGLSGNISLFMASSPLDDPTRFLAAGSGGIGLPLSIVVNAPVTGRYILIVQHTGGSLTDPLNLPQGDVALVVSASGTQFDTSQAIDLATQQRTTRYDLTRLLSFSPAPTPGIPAVMTPVTPVVVTPGITPGAATTPVATQDTGTSFCPGLNLTCAQLSCAQAQACLQAGNFALDTDDDGFACEETGCPGG